MSGLARTLKGIKKSFKESENMTTAEGRKFFEEREKQGKVDLQKQYEVKQERERQERISREWLRQPKRNKNYVNWHTGEHIDKDLLKEIRLKSADNLAKKKRERQEQYKAQQERERQERLQVLKKKFKGYYKKKFQTEEKDNKKNTKEMRLELKAAQKKKTLAKKKTKAKKETREEREKKILLLMKTH